ncbi:MAG: GtrA family protein [Variibacter sp.]|nr:GtrA family protein [Variibacter sp.]
MTDFFLIQRLVGAVPWLRHRTLLLKAVSFGLIGVVNAAVDASVFFLARALLSASATLAAASAAVSASCACAAPDTPILVAANVLAWMVAVSGSYVMNTSITFAAESGRRLRWRDYVRFVASGVAGLLANTTTLVVTDDFVPLWAAKGAAIFVGFVVNFSLSHLVVFRSRERDAGAPR